MKTSVILASTNTIFTQKVMFVNMWDLKFWNFSHLKNPRFGLGKFFHFFEFMIKKRRGMDKFQFSLTIKIMISVAKKYNRFSKRHKKH